MEKIKKFSIQVLNTVQKQIKFEMFKICMLTISISYLFYFVVFNFVDTNLLNKELILASISLLFIVGYYVIYWIKERKIDDYSNQSKNHFKKLSLVQKDNEICSENLETKDNFNPKLYVVSRLLEELAKEQKKFLNRKEIK